MILWDIKFLTKLKTLGIIPKMYTRYVDDTVIVIEAIQEGYRLVKNKLIWSKQAEMEDKDVPDDKRSFSILRQIADIIDKDIQWEEDTPSCHNDGKIPVLDLKVWIEDDRSIKFEFYSKPMSSKYTILKRSALSEQTKRSTLFMEAYRRISNCSPNLPWSVKAKHLTNFSYMMMISGYGNEYRYRIIH